MHPGFAFWQARRHAGACGGGSCAEAHAGPEGHHGPGGWRPPWARHDGAFAAAEDGDFGGGAFGVRRPLRFLAYKLELNEEQVAALARILDDLKTERAQAAVDHRRTTAAFADAVAGESFDASAVTAAAASRVTSAERLRDAVVASLAKIHALLDPEQRAKLAYLLRTGALSM
jgi:Spy/CpxP family protein refolding chaperone